jgi:hypothetical protein
MDIDRDKEIEKIERMKDDLFLHFRRSVKNNESNPDASQRRTAAESASAYAALTRAQIELTRLPRKSPAPSSPVVPRADL